MRYGDRVSYFVESHGAYRLIHPDGATAHFPPDPPDPRVLQEPWDLVPRARFLLIPIPPRPMGYPAIHRPLRGTGFLQ